MTLADLIPSLRSSLPRHLEPTLWPATARHLPGGDVALSGVSLRGLADPRPTPVVVHADVPRGARSTVTVCRVRAVRRAPDRTVVEVDPGVGRCPASTAQRRAHLLSRLSPAPDVTVEVRSGGRLVLRETRLPEDLAAGDLLALPAAARGTDRRAPRAAVLTVSDGTALLVDPGGVRDVAPTRRAG